MEGNLIGVFGSNLSVKSGLLNSIAKKSETEGIVVYQRNESGKKYSLLDDATYPERIQGYSRIASIADSAMYVFPQEGKLSPADGELALLLDALNLEGIVEAVDISRTSVAEVVKSSFKGLKISSFPIEERESKSSMIDLSKVGARKDYPRDHTLVYVDRAFNVKGVGLVPRFWPGRPTPKAFSGKNAEG